MISFQHNMDIVTLFRSFPYFKKYFAVNDQINKSKTNPKT